MSSFRFSAFAAFFLSFVFAATPRPAHADTYQLVGLTTDAGYYFYGMDDSGNVVFRDQNCGPALGTCYQTFNPTYSTQSATPPSFAYDFTYTACGATLPCSATRAARTATAIDNHPGESLTVTSGANPPQTLIFAGVGGLAINSFGDIVFDDTTSDNWIEAVDLSVSPAPEPSSLLLLATGILGGAALLTRRRMAVSL